MSADTRLEELGVSGLGEGGLGVDQTGFSDRFPIGTHVTETPDETQAARPATRRSDLPGAHGQVSGDQQPPVRGAVLGCILPGAQSKTAPHDQRGAFTSSLLGIALTPGACVT
jgi:hypothetical protein